jgi:uncharacterized NAD-dependent epimerase/dehydratase family protein
MPTVDSEIQLIEAISQAQVIAITLSHEGLEHAEIPKMIANYEERFQLPTTDVLNDGCDKLIQALSDRFPRLNLKSRLKSKHDFVEKMPVLALR